MTVNYAFIKDGRVLEVYVFAAEDEKLVSDVVETFDYDSAVFVGENNPAKYSTYNGTIFTDPTEEYLISIGVAVLPTETIE
jgi:hypothetical protein